MFFFSFNSTKLQVDAKFEIVNEKFPDKSISENQSLEYCKNSNGHGYIFFYRIPVIHHRFSFCF